MTDGNRATALHHAGKAQKPGDRGKSERSRAKERRQMQRNQSKIALKNTN
jgi:hypothetical protein